MNTVRQLPSQEPRIETGPLCFDGDWTGIFIRGDNALWYAMEIDHAIKTTVMDTVTKMKLQKIADILRSCDERVGVPR